MNGRKQFIFWVISLIILVLLFSNSLGGIVLSLYFVTFLFPVILSTTFIFNRFLVPHYLLQGKRWKFSLYFFYLLVISVYLEMLVMVLAFVILADYQFENLGSIAGDIYLLTIILYLIVFANGFIEILISFQRKARQLMKMEEEQQLNQKAYLEIRANRKTQHVDLDDLTLIESLADYVQIHTTDEIYITKQTISSLEKKLPTRFLRIHRSFIVNADKIESFGKESVQLSKKELTFGRKYKDHALAFLNARATGDNTTLHSVEMN